MSATAVPFRDDARVIDLAQQLAREVKGYQVDKSTTDQVNLAIQAVCTAFRRPDVPAAEVLTGVAAALGSLIALTGATRRSQARALLALIDKAVMDYFDDSVAALRDHGRFNPGGEAH